MESLTKENFWNDLYKAYPDEVQVFCNWIDEYKKRVEWDKLFNAKRIESPVNGFSDIVLKAPKFHELPIAMQIGIFIQFVSESDGQFGLDMPEHISSVKQFEQIPSLIQEYFYYENLHNKKKVITLPQHSVSEALPAKCDTCGCTPSVIIRNEFGTFCKAHANGG